MVQQRTLRSSQAGVAKWRYDGRERAVIAECIGDLSGGLIVEEWEERKAGESESKAFRKDEYGVKF